ncbi:hypothetical protein [Solicola sp. PLA-1-18]|jgi:hypothetical protein|uniref:hypothetical protein n=1 Tax=Solicola sp. PLA-1-18 TaxID=3380532 RepID=UPI003B808B89
MGAKRDRWSAYVRLMESVTMASSSDEKDDRSTGVSRPSCDVIAHPVLVRRRP